MRRLLRWRDDGGLRRVAPEHDEEMGTGSPRHLDACDLPEDIARIAKAQVAAGNFETVEDVVRASVQALEARGDEWRDYARDLWRERKAAAERGEFIEGTPAELMARIRARVERSS